MTNDFDISSHCWMLATGYPTPMAGPMGDRLRFVRAQGDIELEIEHNKSVAVVRLEGIATRRTEFWEKYLDGYSTEKLAEAMERLAADDEVDAIVLWIDSPGGQASGTDSAAQAIAAAAKVKPVVAQVQGAAHSAAYYLAAGATRIVANDDDRVGSIGVIAQVPDTSKLYEDAGIRIVTETTGPIKGTGAPGFPITEEQRAHLRHHVELMFTDFKSFVSEQRGLSAEQVEKLATGAVFTAREAVANGLVDGIATLEETIDSLRPKRASTQPTRNGEQAVSKTDDTPQAAKLDELQACLPGVDDAFCVESMKVGWSLDQAQSTWMERLVAKNKELDAKAKASQAAAEANAPGVDDEEASETPAADAAENAGAFTDQVERLVAKGVDRQDAVMRVAGDNPDAHKAFVEQHQRRMAG